MWRPGAAAPKTFPMRHARPHRTRLTLALSLIGAVLLLAGCESAIAAREAEKHPVEGRLVEVADGRRIQMDCRGTGSPTVVFQSGGDTLGSLAWAPVMEKVSAKTRACAYSRAGIMWSDPASGGFKPEEVARDLHAALEAGGEKPPYVLVGHSRGGLYNMIYAGLYRDEIAGLVFADSSHPDQEKRFAEAGVKQGDYVTPAEEMALALRWTGLLRLTPYPTDASIEQRVKAYYPKSAAANAREARRRGDTLETAGQYRDLQNWPVVVLARELPEQTKAWRDKDARNAYLLSVDGSDAGSDVPEQEVVWRKLQADLATWSSRGRLEVVPESNHAFFFFRPDVIVAAVDEVVRASRVVLRPQLPGLQSGEGCLPGRGLRSPLRPCLP
jgi:pimeloyl-ACP methyl ester carboxylesterase